jgi:hypothetical protein
MRWCMLSDRRRNSHAVVHTVTSAGRRRHLEVLQVRGGQEVVRRKVRLGMEGARQKHGGCMQKMRVRCMLDSRPMHVLGRPSRTQQTRCTFGDSGTRPLRTGRERDAHPVRARARAGGGGSGPGCVLRSSARRRGTRCARAARGTAREREYVKWRRERGFRGVAAADSRGRDVRPVCTGQGREMCVRLLPGEEVGGCDTSSKTGALALSRWSGDLHAVRVEDREVDRVLLRAPRGGVARLVLPAQLCERPRCLRAVPVLVRNRTEQDNTRRCRRGTRRGKGRLARAREGVEMFVRFEVGQLCTPPPSPSPPYKVDTSRAPLRTDRACLVPSPIQTGHAWSDLHWEDGGGGRGGGQKGTCSKSERLALSLARNAAGREPLSRRARRCCCCCDASRAESAFTQRRSRRGPPSPSSFYARCE